MGIDWLQLGQQIRMTISSVLKELGNLGVAGVDDVRDQVAGATGKKDTLQANPTVKNSKRSATVRILPV